jgi:hypothetical protein
MSDLEQQWAYWISIQSKQQDKVPPSEYGKRNKSK